MKTHETTAAAWPISCHAKALDPIRPNPSHKKFPLRLTVHSASLPETWNLGLHNPFSHNKCQPVPAGAAGYTNSKPIPKPRNQSTFATHCTTTSRKPIQTKST